MADVPYNEYTIDGKALCLTRWVVPLEGHQRLAHPDVGELTHTVSIPIHAIEAWHGKVEQSTYSIYTSRAVWVLNLRCHTVGDDDNDIEGDGGQRWVDFDFRMLEALEGAAV